MITALIAAITSLLISLLTLLQSLRNQKIQKDQFEKGQNRALTTKLYDLRMEHYPKAFEITEWIQKVKGDNIDPKMVIKVNKEINIWKTGVVSLVISYDSRIALLKFKDAINKQPGLGDNYAKVQVEKIWKTRSEFRRQLRKDIGLLHKEGKFHLDKC